MRSTFFGLDIAYRALQAQQQAIDVVSHNIANASTPGYSRQTAILAATLPFGTPSVTWDAGPGQMGTGVEVIDVRRARYGFLDRQIQNELQTLGQWEKMRDALKQVEAVLNEPSDSGLNSLLSKFWQSWQDLSSAPQDAGARRALVEQAESLASGFQHTYAQLTEIRRDLDRQIVLGSARINDLAQQIASLNVRISQVETLGQRANDLRDQRDLLLDELSRLARVTYYETPEGAINVFLGNRMLVFRDRAEQLSIEYDSDKFATIVWDSDGNPISGTSGELYGLQQARDVRLPQIVAELDELAGQIIVSVNAIHRIGFGLDNSTGLDFFLGSGLEDVVVNPDLKSNPERVAAAGASDSPGDNAVALAIARLQRDRTMDGGTTDFGGFLASLVSRLGVDCRRADVTANNQKLIVDHLDRQRESVSGVSLDEEATRLIQYQRAYEAAARIVNAVDEMLNKLINDTGLVGR